MQEKPDLRERLQEQTRILHVQAHALPFFQALFKHYLPVESYVGQLRSLAIIHAALERQLDILQDMEPFPLLLRGYRPKLPLLLADLEHFAQPFVQDILPAVHTALEIADGIMVQATENPLALIGSLYTLEGSTQGGRTMAPHILQTFDLTADAGASYFHCYGNRVTEHWQNFVHRLRQIDLSEEMQERVVNSCKDIFTALIQVYQALYPVDHKQFGRHVTSLNPEAGNHPIPTDPKRVQATLRAAHLCWKAFTYLQIRYGERGWRFTLSDAAWLVTMSDMKVIDMLDNICWLVELLANRGIPSLIMEKQLLFLHNELLQEDPERRLTYDRLLFARDAIRQRRNKALPPHAEQEIAQNLEIVVASSSDNPIPELATLLAAAHADQCSGLDQALSGIMDWLQTSRILPSRTLDQIQNVICGPSRR